MSRTSLKQQLMREQMVQQERKEAQARQQQQLQKLQSNSRLTPQHLNIGSTVINNNTTSSVIAITGTGVGGGGGVGRSIPHSIGPMKISEAASCPNFFTEGFNNTSNGPLSSSNLHPGSSSTTSSTLITSSSTTTANSSNTTPSKLTNHHHPQHASHHHSSFMSGGGGGNGSGPQSPFPLSPDSPHSGPRSSASEMDEYWEDVQRTLVMEMPDLVDQNGNNDGTMGSEHVVSNSINVIHHHSHQSSHHSPMDPIASTLPADIGYSFNPHQIYGGEDSLQSTSQLSDVTKMSSSCPPLSTSCPPLSSDPAEYSAWERERKKKDAHNKIERRRRYNINDRIKELSTLLPTQDETYYELVKDMKQNKGTILKASVDFVKELKRDVSRIPELEQKNRELELKNEAMTRRLQQLEQLEQDLRTHSISEEPHGLYKPESSAPKSIQFGQQAHHHAHHIHNSTNHGTPTPPPHPQSLPQHHLSQSFHHTTSETDYWINGGITMDDNTGGGGNSLQSLPQHITSSSLGHHLHHLHHNNNPTDLNSDLVDSIYGSSRMSTTHHHPIIKQEYNVSPSQSSSGLGSLSSPTSLSSSFLPLSQMLLDTTKDSLGINSSHVKGELPSSQVMDVCD